MKLYMNMFNRTLFSIIIMSLLLTTACNHFDDDLYIISKSDSLAKIEHTNKDGISLVPPKFKYAPYTFIIDSAGNFYFYCMPEERPQSFFDGDEPEYLGLQPNRVFSVPNGFEQKFFERNVLYQKSSRGTKGIMIASYKDSINSKFLKDLIEFTKVKENKMGIQVRLALPEEREVLRFKLAGLYYDPKF